MSRGCNALVSRKGGVCEKGSLRTSRAGFSLQRVNLASNRRGNSMTNLRSPIYLRIERVSVDGA